MSDWDDTRDAVVDRAGSRCEYCRMHQSLQGATFHIEHVIPQSCGGDSNLDNLALACPSCNLHKSNLVRVPDPDSAASVNLFHPRTDNWTDHFDWNGYRLTGLTPTGRATVSTLQFNTDRRMRIREVEERFGLFPPE